MIWINILFQKVILIDVAGLVWILDELKSNKDGYYLYINMQLLEIEHFLQIIFHLLKKILKIFPFSDNHTLLLYIYLLFLDSFHNPEPNLDRETICSFKKMAIK